MKKSVDNNEANYAKRRKICGTGGIEIQIGQSKFALIPIEQLVTPTC